MEALEFIAILAIIITMALWYALNEERGADGTWGWFSIKPDPEAAPKARKRYRMKTRQSLRGARRGDNGPLGKPDVQSASYAHIEDKFAIRRQFRRQDEARYRVKDRFDPNGKNKDEDR